MSSLEAFQSRAEAGAANGTAAAEAPELAAAYERAFTRLMGFEDVPPHRKRHAWDLLIGWRDRVLTEHGVAVPTPFVFANDDLEVEFEWEAGGRQLMLRIAASGKLEFLKTETRGAEETHEEGATDLSGAPELLAWAFKA
jgi:hypothetical protein